MKNSFRRTPESGFALGLDVRLPTGDEMELTGTGTTGLQPFVIWSATVDRVSPHVNAGYQWNGASVLAGKRRFREAMEELLEVIRLGRHGQADTAREQLLALFTLAASEPTLVAEYRRKLASALH